MWNYNGEDDTSRYGRKGPDNFAALAAMLADLYKGEKEEFTRLKCRESFSMYNPPSWEWRKAVVGIYSPAPQPEDHIRDLDPRFEEDPDISVELKEGVFYQESYDGTEVAITADYPSLLPSSHGQHSSRHSTPEASLKRAEPVRGSSDQLEEKLKAAQADKQHVERQEAAGQRVLTRTRDEKNKLQDANTQLGEELKDVQAQLADALKEIRKLRGGVLTGRPEKEVSGFQGDLLQELSKVHEQARKAMRNITKALWLADSPPGRPRPSPAGPSASPPSSGRSPERCRDRRHLDVRAPPGVLRRLTPSSKATSSLPYYKAAAPGPASPPHIASPPHSPTAVTAAAISRRPTPRQPPPPSSAAAAPPDPLQPASPPGAPPPR
nr:formin-like protein 1 [Aegilops tauschii subsp. strangulata]